RRVSHGASRAGCCLPRGSEKSPDRISLVRILLDECIDWRLGRELVGHEVKTAQQMGWATIQNGALLRQASNQFDAFVTVDRNLSFQQNIPTFSIAVFVLRATSNRLAALKALVPQLMAGLARAEPGTIMFIGDR